MSYFVYVIRSLSSNHFYIGYTSDLNGRLLCHNSGKVQWTSRNMPWELKYFETFDSKKDALKREKYFKSHAGRNWLKNLGP